VVSAGGPLLVLDGVHLQSSLAVHLSTPPSLPSSSPSSSSSSSPASAVLRYALRVQNLGEAEAAGGGDGGNGLMPVVSLVVRRFDWKAVLGVQELCLFDQERVAEYGGQSRVPSSAVFSACDGARSFALHNGGHGGEDDDAIEDSNSPAKPKRLLLQGLSPGWQVTYATGNIDRMELDISGLPPGNYTLEATLNQVFEDSPAYTTTASFVIPDPASCHLVAHYSDPVLSSMPASEWIDPRTNGHQRIALSSQESPSWLIPLSGSPWLFGCMHFSSFQVDLHGRLSFTSHGAAANTRLDFGIAPFNAIFTGGKLYYRLEDSSHLRHLIVSWVDMKTRRSGDGGSSWQAEINESGDVVFRYEDITSPTTAGSSAPQKIHICSFGTTPADCMIYGPAVVKSGSEIRFPRRSPPAHLTGEEEEEGSLINLLEPIDSSSPTQVERWSTNDTLAVVLGTTLPLLTIAILLLGIILVVFCLCRGMVPSGGHWWKNDAEYVNTGATTVAATQQ